MRMGLTSGKVKRDWQKEDRLIWKWREKGADSGINSITAGLFL